MDDQRFDELAKDWATRVSRRSVVKGGLGGALVAALSSLPIVSASAQDAPVTALGCAQNGVKCRPSLRLGTKHQHPCRKCCSRYSVKVRKGRRCACRPGGMSCNYGHKCCSGVCTSRTCSGQQQLRERGGNGTFAQADIPGCESTPEGCPTVIEGDITGGTPISDGTFSGTFTSSETMDNGDGTFTTPVSGPVTLTEDGTGQMLEFDVDGEVVSEESGAFTFTGTYQITGETGRFAGATGNGTVTFSGRSESDAAGFIDSFRLDGTINYA